MISNISNKLIAFLDHLEKKYGVYLTSLIIAFLLLCIAAIYVTPALEPMQLGRGYARLSEHPINFSEDNVLRYRILTPFLAYCVGLRGSLYIIFTTIIALFFLSSIYIFLRKTIDAIESFLIVCLICFSTPILFLLHYQGYVDVTSYLLIFLIFIFIRKPFLFLIFLSLLILNHASNLFAIPFLAFYYLMKNGYTIKNIALLTLFITIAFVPFFLFMNYLSPKLGMDNNFAFYYLHIKECIKTVATFFYVGIFNSFKLFWIFPLLAVYFYWKEKNREQIIFYSLIMICTLSQMLLATDTSRLMGLAFPLIIFGAIKLKGIWGQKMFVKVSLYIILLNFIIPQYYVGQSVMIRFYPLPASLILKYFFGIETWVG